MEKIIKLLILTQMILLIGVDRFIIKKYINVKQTTVILVQISKKYNNTTYYKKII